MADRIIAPRTGARSTTAPQVPMDVPVPQLGGLTVDQVRMVIEQAASAMDTMATMCMNYGFACDETDGDPVSYHALQLLAERTGAMLDMATGSPCLGSPGRWLAGPVFEAAGERPTHTPNPAARPDQPERSAPAKQGS